MGACGEGAWEAGWEQKPPERLRVLAINGHDPCGSGRARLDAGMVVRKPSSEKCAAKRALAPCFATWLAPGAVLPRQPCCPDGWQRPARILRQVSNATGRHFVPGEVGSESGSVSSRISLSSRIFLSVARQVETGAETD